MKLKNSWKRYLNSFKVKEIWQVLVVDLTFFAFFFIVFRNIKSILTSSVPKEMVGKTPEQLQGMVGTNPEKLVEIILPIQKYLLTYFLTFLIFFLFAFLLYSLSRSLVWEVIINKRKLVFLKHFKWNLLNLVLIVPLICFIIFSMIIKFVFGGTLKYLLTSSTYLQLNYQNLIKYTHSTLTGIVSFYLIFMALCYFFFVYDKFVDKKKVFKSIIDGLNFIHNKFKEINKFILCTLLTLIPFFLITILFERIFFTYPNILLYFNGILSFIYLAWFRMYFVKEILHK